MIRFSRLIVLFTLLSSLSPLAALEEFSGKGTVAETLYVESYVYVRLAEDDTWIAAAPIQVAVGDYVEYGAGVQMGQFQSTTLGRTFDSIIFAGSLRVITPAAAEHHSASANPHAVEKSATATPPAAGEIAPLEGGKTIEQILAAGAQLADQQVSLRARVVKVSEDILGRNWITLQDGTGKAPENKLIATSEQLADVGELVTVTGKLRSDVDLGSGYRYTVLLEEASFSRQLESGEQN